jgi:hypothetical protein
MKVERIKNLALDQRRNINSNQDDKETLKKLILWVCTISRENINKQRTLLPEQHLTSIEECITQWEQSAQKI